MFLRFRVEGKSLLVHGQCARARCGEEFVIDTDLDEAAAVSGLAGRLASHLSVVALVKQATVLMGVDPLAGVGGDLDVHLYCDRCAAFVQERDEEDALFMEWVDVSDED